MLPGGVYIAYGFGDRLSFQRSSRSPPSSSSSSSRYCCCFVVGVLGAPLGVDALLLLLPDLLCCLVLGVDGVLMFSGAGFGGMYEYWLFVGRFVVGVGGTLWGYPGLSCGGGSGGGGVLLE